MSTVTSQLSTLIPTIPVLGSLRGALNELSELAFGSTAAVGKILSIVSEYAGILGLQGYVGLNLTDLANSVFALGINFDPCSADFPNVFRDSTGEYIASIGDQTITYDFNVAGTHGQPQLFGLLTQNATRRAAYWTNDQVVGRVNASTYGLTVVDFAFDLSGDFTHYTWWRTAANGSVSIGAYPSATALIIPVTTITSGKAPTLSGSSVFDITSTRQADNQAMSGGAGPYSAHESGVLSRTFSSAAYSSLIEIRSLENSIK